MTNNHNQTDITVLSKPPLFWAGGRQMAAATAINGDASVDLKWAAAAIQGELSQLKQLPGGSINRPDSEFWVSLVKIASIIKGSGKGHFTAADGLRMIAAAFSGPGWQPTAKELNRQWQNALKKSKPRYRNEGARGAGSALLGNTTSFANPTGVAPRKKVTKWQMQTIAAGIVGGDFRINNCMFTQIAKKTVIMRNKDGRAYYSGLMTCGSVWVCPVCSVKVAAQRAEEINRALSGSDLVPVLVTYTLQHTRKDSLDQLMKDLKAALRYTLQGAVRKRFMDAFGVVGYIKSFETRVSDRAGWHPHCHELILIKPGKTINTEAIKEFLNGRYGSYLRDRGYLVNEHTIDVRVKTQRPGENISDYLTKSAIELELTAGQYKPGQSLSPFQLLAAYKETGDPVFAALFKEYAKTTKGKKWLVWSRGLRKYLGLDEEETDEDIAADEEDGDILAQLSRKEWNRVIVKGLRGDLLMVASLTGSIGLLQWLYSVGVIKGESDMPLRTIPP